MNKHELIASLKSGGYKPRVEAARRISHSKEFAELADDDQITMDLVATWKEDSPRLNNGHWKVSLKAPLSKNEIRHIETALRREKRDKRQL